MAPTGTDHRQDKLEEKLAEYQRLSERREDLDRRLRRTEAEKESVSTRIYERVRSDYQTELSSIDTRLNPLKDELEGLRRDASAELADLEEVIRTREDMVAEAEFRHRVGEYDTSRLTRVTGDIETELVDKRARRDELNEILSLLDRRRSSSDDDAPADETSEGEDEAGGELLNDDDFVSYTDPPAEDFSSVLDDPANDAPVGQKEYVIDDEPDETLVAHDTEYDISDDVPAEEPVAQPVSDNAGADADSDDVTSQVDHWFDDPMGWPDDGKFKKGSKKKSPATAVADAEDDPLAALADPSSETGGAVDHSQTPTLMIRSGAHRGRTIPLLPMTMTVGREHDNNIEIKDPDVARYHARIVYENGTYSVEDLETSTGTIVNGEKAICAPLKSGDVIKIGGTELVFEGE